MIDFDEKPESTVLKLPGDKKKKKKSNSKEKRGRSLSASSKKSRPKSASSVRKINPNSNLLKRTKNTNIWDEVESKRKIDQRKFEEKQRMIK